MDVCITRRVNKISVVPNSVRKTKEKGIFCLQSDPNEVLQVVMSFTMSCNLTEPSLFPENRRNLVTTSESGNLENLSVGNKV